VQLYRDLTAIRTGPDAASIGFECKDVIIEIERYDEGLGRSAAYIDQRVEALGPKEVLATALEAKAASFQQEIGEPVSDDIAAGTAIRVSGILRPDERRGGHQEWHYQTSITLIVVAEESL
jgi:hypothetical protein